MATPPRKENEQGNPHRQVQEIKHLARVGASSFTTHITAYDIAHDLPFTKAGKPNLSIFNLEGMDPAGKLSVKEWASNFHVLDQEYGDEAKEPLGFTAEGTVTLLIGLRPEKGRAAPLATFPSKPAPAAKHKSETAAQYLLYTDHMFQSIKHWVQMGPTQDYCVRSWEYRPPKSALSATIPNPPHLYTITVPTSQSAYLDVFKQAILEHVAFPHPSTGTGRA